MKSAISVLLVLVLCQIGYCQTKDVPLTIEGDTLLVVKSLPFKVRAAEGSKIYIWSVPDGFSATKNKNVLTVTKAPKGIHKINVVGIKFDKETQDLIEDSGSTTVSIGDILPGPDPNPDPNPPPIDSFQELLQKTYDSNKESDKSSSVASLTLVYKAAAKMVRDGKVNTMGQFFKAMIAGEEAIKVVGKVKDLKQICHDKEFSQLPTKSDDKIDQSNFEKIASAYDRCALALEKIKK